MPFSQCKSKRRAREQEPGGKVEQAGRMDFDGIVRTTAGTPRVLTHNEFTIFRQPGLVIERVMADGRASDMV
jgi:hypothetical protein